MTRPSTILDDTADEIREIRDRIVDDELEEGTPYTDVQDMLDRGAAVTRSLSICGQEFTLLAYPRQGYRNHSIKVKTALFHPDVDLSSLDEGVRRSTTIAKKHVNSASLHDDDAKDDVQHMLATCIGYLVRYALDGRDYGRRGDHDDPPVSPESADDD